ncbi:MAG: antibiotic biosynthesis monooxygenase [Spartobacteria bacterium]|nr:antibiotic biosynthesis monooxygenase [Spartobacteria bacterium]
MYVTLVHVWVKKEHVDEFIEACRLNHEQSTQEPGNRRFDILRSAEEPEYVVLYEAYADEAAAAAHKETRHYQAWRDTVAGWMAKPRRGEKFNGLYPA